MKIKTKLTLGVGLLFLMILLLSLVSSRYLFELRSDTENVLVDNYRTLEYAKTMLISLEETTDSSLKRFDLTLKDQENNITEIGELDLTQRLRGNFNQYSENYPDETLQFKIRQDIFEIMEMNMRAIKRKSQQAQQTANTAVFWILLTGGSCFTIAFFLLIRLPSTIADPIRKMTESIQQIKAKNYSERVDFQDSEEFSQLAESFNSMAEKLEEYNNSSLAKIMKEKKRVEALIDKMHDPVIGLDENMRILFANEEAKKIMSVSNEELMDRDARELALKNDLLRELIKDLGQGKNLVGPAKPMKIFADGKEGYFEKEIQSLTVTPTGDTIPEIIGFVILLRNVTEYKELDSAKTNFIATVSHEFKTPISSIKMSLQLLENEEIGKLNEEQKNLIASLGDDANRLLKITGELLNVTQVESGNIQITPQSIDLREVIHYAVNATKTQAEQKQISIEIQCPDSLSDVHADMEKTAWVITNLISNAIRYSYEDSTIELIVTEEESQIIFAIKDSGQGIAPQYRGKIFDRYFRVPGTKKEGTGLGLAISKEFMEAQGGQISVESELGVGSIFYLFLKKGK